MTEMEMQSWETCMKSSHKTIKTEGKQKRKKIRNSQRQDTGENSCFRIGVKERGVWWGRE